MCATWLEVAPQKTHHLAIYGENPKTIQVLLSKVLARTNAREQEDSLLSFVGRSKRRIGLYRFAESESAWDGAGAAHGKDVDICCSQMVWWEENCCISNGHRHRPFGTKTLGKELPLTSKVTHFHLVRAMRCQKKDWFAGWGHWHAFDLAAAVQHKSRATFSVSYEHCPKGQVLQPTWRPGRSRPIFSSCPSFPLLPCPPFHLTPALSPHQILPLPISYILHHFSLLLFFSLYVPHPPPRPQPVALLFPRCGDQRRLPICQI